MDNHSVNSETESSRSRNLVTSFYRSHSDHTGYSFGNKTHGSHPHFDFISTLALAQERNVDFLPFTWKPNMDDNPSNTLVGGTANINQLRVTINTSMVFKVVKVFDKFNAFDYESSYRAVCHEIAILTSPQLQGHPNFVQFEGLSWNVDDDDSDKIKSVLVFQKASCGDASMFFESDESTHMSFDEKLQLCIGIGRAVMLMHSCRMVHGDLKPQNILIDRDTTGRFTARVADFGYSLLYSKDQFHTLPKSRPWNAPEISSFEIDFDNAVSADVYSYAMVCLWILFQDKVVLNPLKKDGSHLNLKHPYKNIAIIEELQNADELKNVAHDMLAHEGALSPDLKNTMSRFFGQTLVKDDSTDSSTARETNVKTLLAYLGDTLGPEATDHDAVIEDAIFPQADFQISPSLLQLSRADYRVRRLLISELQKNAEEHECSVCQENSAYQLALCYRLGFGVKRNLPQSLYWLRRSERDDTFENVMRKFSQDVEETSVIPLEGLWQKSHIDVEMIYLKAFGTENFYHNPRMSALYNEHTLASFDYVQEYNTAGISILEVIDIYRTEVLDIQEELGDHHEVVFSLRNILARLLKDVGQLEEAKNIALELYNNMIAHRQFGPGHNETILQMNFLAEVYHAEGDFEAAKTQFQLALDSQQKSLGMNHLATLKTLHNLAETLSDEGKYDEAEEHCSNVLSGRQNILGEENLDTIISMNSLGTIRIKQDDLTGAEEMLSRAEALSSKILGPTSYITLSIVNNLAAVLHFQGKSAESQSKLEASLRISRATMGPSHPATSIGMINLSHMMLSQGNNNDARSLCQTAAENLEEKLGPGHPSTLVAKSLLSLLAETDNDYQLAETLSREVFEISEQVLGETHPATLDRADTLGSMLKNLGKYADAESMYQWALEKKEKALGKGNPQTLITVHNLADIYYIDEKYDEALKLFKEAYEGLAAIRGRHHSSTLMSLGKLASTYSRIKEYEMTERLAREAIQGFKELDRKIYDEETGAEPSSSCGLDMEHISISEADDEVSGTSIGAISESPTTLTAISILGGILERANKDAEAELIHRHVLQAFESQCGPDDHDTLLAMSKLVNVLHTRAKYAEAMEIAVRAEAGFIDLLGPDHPDAVVAKTNVSTLKKKIMKD